MSGVHHCAEQEQPPGPGSRPLHLKQKARCLHPGLPPLQRPRESVAASGRRKTPGDSRSGLEARGGHNRDQTVSYACTHSCTHTPARRHTRALFPSPLPFRLRCLGKTPALLLNQAYLSPLPTPAISPESQFPAALGRG